MKEIVELVEELFPKEMDIGSSGGQSYFAFKRNFY